jgi:DNA polymerase elongation subunit (family B)
MKNIFLDVECYSNYFLICFSSIDKVVTYELSESSTLSIKEITNIMGKYTTIGYNSKNYDLPMIVYALNGASNKELKRLSDKIVESNEPAWKVANISIPQSWDHIDLIKPSPDIKVSLKMYGARLHSKKLQDLPIEPDTILTSDQMVLIKDYCLNDIQITIDLYNRIEDRLNLRIGMAKIWDIDFRSKSNPQVAEAVIKKLLKVKTYKNEIDLNQIYRYIAPKYITFETENLKSLKGILESIDFKCGKKGKLLKNKEFPKRVNIDGVPYTIGLGGLHSNEKHIYTSIGEEEFLLNIDVISYYPNLILTNKYYPEKLGAQFLDIYQMFYQLRIKAKKEGNKLESDAYKIILNGSFGKFGSKFSCLYSPQLLLSTTLTGQLSLLMLIEKLTLEHFNIVSANTDGITLKGKKENLPNFENIITSWEKGTGLTLEKTWYTDLYHESVNSYIAITDSNEVICKGFYADEGLTKNPIHRVCVKAVINYITNKVDIGSTIMKNRFNVTDFLLTRKVDGGALYKDKYLGKVVRWYYGTDGDKITYKRNGNKVANSDNAVPLMDLNHDKFENIDYQIYINKSYDMLKNLGIKI